MITFKKFGKTIKIRNDDWKKLRKRYDTDKAEWHGVDSLYEILEACPLCARYFSHCQNCPFWEFKDDEGGVACWTFMEKLFKHIHFDAGHEEITWSKRNNKLARKQLGQLLKMMDKIEASQ